MDFVISCLRTLFFSLDKIVFGLVDDVYSLLMQIARTTIFDQDALHSFSQRVYAMLGLFMLFKVMVSIINYILNPDELVDKEKGFTSIIKRIILSLVMVVLVPYAFREAYELQSIILGENTIMTIIFGSPGESYRKSSGTSHANSTFYDTAGQKIQFTVLYTFARPNIEEFTGDPNYDLSDCVETYRKENGNFAFRENGISSSGDVNKKSGYIYQLNESCFGTYDPNEDTYTTNEDTTGHLLALFKSVSLEKEYQNYAQGVAQQSMSLFFRKDIFLAKTEDGTYLIDYKWGISTAVGVATLYLLLLFCIDIAGRSIKLGFLQLISPIPIISYCDPKSGKDGMFKKWYTMCFKAYAELFIKLFALYFGIYIISLVGTFKDVLTGEAVDNWLVSVFMIIGVLIFIKKLPDIIKEALGVDLGGKLELNPLKKLENEMVGGKLVSGAGKKAVGVAGGVAAGTLATAAGMATGQGLHRKNFTSAIASGWKGDKFGKMFSTSYGAGRERHKQLQEMKADGVHRGQVTAEKFKNIFRGQTPSEKVKAVSDGLKAIQDDYKSYETTSAGVDALAKDFDKRRKAAEAEGNYEQGKRWQKAFEDRVKYIAANGGKVMNSTVAGFNAESIIDNDGNLYSGQTYDAQVGKNRSGADDFGENSALKNIASHMDALVDALNSQGSQIAGYQQITASTSSDIKGVRNQALGSQQSVDTNSINRTQADIEKYAGTTGKKS